MSFALTLGFGSEKSKFPALEKCLPYFSNLDIEEKNTVLTALSIAARR
jgi:hypothetical protein